MDKPPSESTNTASTKSNITIAAPTKHEHEYATGSKLVLILVATTLAYFLVMLDTTIVATAIPRITTEFHSLLDIGWYGSAYQLASASFQPLSGKIYTHFSTKWAFLTFFFIFELGSALCGAANSSPMFIAGRAIAGLGSSGLMNGTFVIWSACVVPNRLPVLQSFLISVGQLGVAGGPLLGGALTQFTMWRWCFFINLPIGAVTGILLLLISIPEHTPKDPVCNVLAKALKVLDLIGFFIFAPAAAMFFLALEFGGNHYAWNSTMVIGLLCGAAATFAIFFCWEWYCGEAAMIPFGLLRQRMIWSASIMMFGFLGMMFTVAYYLPIYLQAVHGYSPFMSGVHNLPSFLSQVVVVLVAGFVVQKMGYCLPPTLCGTILACVGSGLLSTLQVSTTIGHWLGFQIVYGFGVGMVVQMPFISFQCLVPRPKIPAAMAILILTQYFGAALWLTVAQSILSNSMWHLIPQYTEGVDAAMIISGGATEIRKMVLGSQLRGVLAAYSKSFDRVMYLACSLAAASFVFAFGLGWKTIKTVNHQTAEVGAEVKTKGQPC